MRWIRPWISDEVGGVMYYQTMVGCAVEESGRRSSVLRILLREKIDPITYGPRPAVPGSSQSRPVGNRIMVRDTMHEIETGAVQSIMTLPGRYLNERSSHSLLNNTTASNAKFRPRRPLVLQTSPSVSH